MKTKALKRFLLTLVFTTLTIALSACSGDKAGEDSSQITIGIPQDIEDSLDPHKAVAAGTEEVLFNLYEGLVKPDSSGELQPAVASDYRISEDATTYTFTLRDGVKFHDGSPVTAEDVKYSIDRCADTTNGEPLVAAYSHIQSVNIVDEKTIEAVSYTHLYGGGGGGGRDQDTKVRHGAGNRQPVCIPSMCGRRYPGRADGLYYSKGRQGAASLLL